MTEGHSHTPATGRHLVIAIILNALIVIVEFVGGILTNSRALISDSLHNLSYFFALILSFIALRVVQWKSNSEKSYGYVRVEIFVAFINATALVLIGMFIIYQGIQGLPTLNLLSAAGCSSLPSLALL
jgi:cobalt-zinc-cadmium efflux system protein